MLIAEISLGAPVDIVAIMTTKLLRATFLNLYSVVSSILCWEEAGKVFDRISTEQK
jgi:hypothetical protein